MCHRKQQTSDNLIVKDNCFIIEIFNKFSFSGILVISGQSPTAKISPVETNPENTHSHKIAHRISSPRDDKLNL